jgi:hypothetical protein
VNGERCTKDLLHNEDPFLAVLLGKVLLEGELAREQHDVQHQQRDEEVLHSTRLQPVA